MTPAIVPPAELGVDPQRVEALRSRVAHAVEKGPLPSAQIALARHGRLLLFETFGAADNATRYCVYSCTKPLVAAAAWKLMGEGLLDVSARVASYLPVFTGGGKEAVTVQDLLCHTGGFPNAVLEAPDWWTSASRLARMATWELEWQPGTQVLYHPLSAHWVLAEIISAVAGQDYRDYLYEQIIRPLGLGALRLGTAVHEGGAIAQLQHVGEPPSARELQALVGTSAGWPDPRDASLLLFNDPAVRELGIPGGGAVSTAADMALFYQALMQNTGSLWDAATLEDAIGTIRVDMPDPMTGCPANRGLGVVIAGDDKFLPYRGMGDKVSPRAFGHQGVGGQVTWGDAATGLSFCLLTNGLDAHAIRSAHLCAAASNRAGACVPRAAQ